MHFVTCCEEFPIDFIELCLRSSMEDVKTDESNDKSLGGFFYFKP